MARKIKTKYVAPSVKYFAYFDPETLRITCVTNDTEPREKFFVEMSKEDYTHIGIGKKHAHEYKINQHVNFDGTVEYSLMTQKLFDEYTVKSKYLEHIKNAVNEGTELNVCCNLIDQQWEFSITDLGRKVLSGSMYDNTLIFFLVLESNFDFLIRTFQIRIHDLLKSDKISYNFENNKEYSIDNIAIVTKKMFTKYGLKIND